MLATGYLGNPASYYGHTFLKFDHAESRSNLQDTTVNYGAIVDTPDDPVTYILKGIFGGYDGGFSDIAYHFHRTQYGENELRDLWEYRLNLTPQQALTVAAHAWEVLGQRYDYYFFRRNCAYRMAEIVEVLDGVELIPKNRPWTLPQATIQLAARATKPDGQPLVQTVNHEPSRQQRFYNSHDVLDAQTRTVLKRVALLDRLRGQPDYEALPLSSKQALADALIDYHLFVGATEDKESGRLHTMYAAALAERYALPPGRKMAHAQIPRPPHESRPASYAQLAQVIGPKGHQTQLRIRAAYYDALDGDAAHVPYSALSMGDLTLRTRGSRLNIHQLDLIGIESANPGVSGLPGDQGEAWRLRAGWEQQRPSCQDCLTARVQADMGVGRRLHPKLHGTLLAGGALQTRSQVHGAGFARMTGAMLWQASDRLASRVQVERRWPLAARQGPYWTAQAEARWRWREGSDTLDTRVSVQHDSGASRRPVWTLGMGLYW